MLKEDKYPFLEPSYFRRPITEQPSYILLFVI